MGKIFSIKFFDAKELNKRDTEDTTVNEALQTIYPQNESSHLCILWNGAILDLEMYDEIADIYWDIIKMLYDMYEQPLSETKVHWGSNTFMAEWIITPNEDKLIITAYWTALSHHKHLIPELNVPNNAITIEKHIFISYWLHLLEKIQSDLIKQGYNKYNLEDFHHIEKIFKLYNYPNNQ